MKRFSCYLLSVLIVLLISSGSIYGEVKLSVIFGDNMVLQQQTSVAVWGTAANNSTVKVTTSGLPASSFRTNDWEKEQ